MINGISREGRCNLWFNWRYIKMNAPWWNYFSTNAVHWKFWPGRQRKKGQKRSYKKKLMANNLVLFCAEYLVLWWPSPAARENLAIIFPQRQKSCIRGQSCRREHPQWVLHCTITNTLFFSPPYIEFFEHNYAPVWVMSRLFNRMEFHFSPTPHPHTHTHTYKEWNYAFVRDKIWFEKPAR